MVSTDDPQANGSTGDPQANGSNGDAQANEQKKEYKPPAPEKCLKVLNYFLQDEKKGLTKRFYNNDEQLKQPSIQASSMVQKLVTEHDCTPELALKFTALTLYDLVILLDDSSSMDIEEDGKRKESLRRVLEEVSKIYTLARPEGVVSVRFLNTRQGRRNVVPAKIDNVLKEVRWYGVTQIGTQLQKKILDPFIVKKAATQTKPVLVMVITDGNIEEEPKDLLRKTIKNCIANLQKDEDDRGEDAVAFYFARIGNDEGAKRLIKTLDDDQDIGEWIDCFPVDTRIENVKDEKKKWNVLSKLLLGALYRSIDKHDIEEDDDDEDMKELDVKKRLDAKTLDDDGYVSDED